MSSRHTPPEVPSGFMSINEVARACALTPSVLRIWETRYGWPSPHRRPNGYRVYPAHQVEEIHRVAALVHAGRPIRSLIVDGAPALPANAARPPRRRALDVARGLPIARDSAGHRTRTTLIDALEAGRVGEAESILQRAVWEFRPMDEPLVVLVPALVALAELRSQERIMDGETKLLEGIATRADRLARQARSNCPAVAVVAGSGACDKALAALVAALLIQRGCAAGHLPGAAPGQAWILAGSTGGVGDAARRIGRVTALPEDGATEIGILLGNTLPFGLKRC